MFVPGRIHHVDGLVADGEVVFVHPFRYLNDCLSFRSDDRVADLPLTRQDPLYDRLVFCGIAGRTGGGMISAMVRHAFGIDLDKEWLYAECGLPSTADTSRYRPAGALCVPPRNGVLEQLPAAAERPGCVREAMFTGAVGQEFHSGVKSGLFPAGYVVDGDSEEDVATHLEHVAGWFSDNSR
ncbi:hypothetical protein ABZ871_32030 [Streptomyces populi]